MRILGIDPGLQRTGWGVITATGNQLSFVACGHITTRKEDAMQERLATLHRGLKQVVSLHSPDSVALEEVFVSVNGASTLKLGQARGAILTLLGLEGLAVHAYSPREVKQTVTGSGKGDKTQVAQMVRFFLPSATAKTADEADALAIALTHAQLAPWKAVVHTSQSLA
jgi:crossover junction endodeoxyribonuclease RuvC